MAAKLTQDTSISPTAPNPLQPCVRMDEGSCNNLLSALLDGPFRILCDRNHVDPNWIPVWDQDRQPMSQAGCSWNCWGATHAVMTRRASGALKTCWRSQPPDRNHTAGWWATPGSRHS